MRQAQAETPPSGFRFSPRGPFQVRNYDGENPADLEPAYALVGALLDKHALLIPGSMARLMRQWRDDLRTAIDAGSAPQAGPRSDGDRHGDGDQHPQASAGRAARETP